MKIVEDVLYTKDHEWAKVEGNIVTVGITDFAQRELGDIVYIEIESEGEDLVQEDVFGTVEAVKTVADLFMPISGKVVEVNAGLEDAPETLNTDPTGEGWLVKIEVADASQLDALMDATAYKDLINA
jgi:glycine cleavage system H protein